MIRTFVQQARPGRLVIISDFDDTLSRWSECGIDEHHVAAALAMERVASAGAVPVINTGRDPLERELAPVRAVPQVRILGIEGAARWRDGTYTYHGGWAAGVGAVCTELREAVRALPESVRPRVHAGWDHVCIRFDRLFVDPDHAASAEPTIRSLHAILQRHGFDRDHDHDLTFGFPRVPVGKGAAAMDELLVIAGERGPELSVICFGDGDNDIPLFEAMRTLRVFGGRNAPVRAVLNVAVGLPSPYLAELADCTLERGPVAVRSCLVDIADRCRAAGHRAAADLSVTPRPQLRHDLC